MAKINLSEDLKRFKNLLGYDPAKGNTINERRVSPNRRAYLTEDEPTDGEDEENTDEEGGDFDFGGGDEEKTDQEGGDNTDFDFGDEGSPEDEKTDQEGGDEEPVEDEFGTADEFSASDEIDTSDDEVEEIDVTSLVNGSNDAKEMAQQAVTIGQENSGYLKALTDKLSNLESQLSKMDTIASKLGKLEQDIKTPEEKLELRSLDSYPYNMKLSDYWEEKASKDNGYRITTGEKNIDGEKEEYTLRPEDIDSSYNEQDVKKSFMPESYKRKLRR